MVGGDGGFCRSFPRLSLYDYLALSLSYPIFLSPHIFHALVQNTLFTLFFLLTKRLPIFLCSTSSPFYPLPRHFFLFPPSPPFFDETDKTNTTHMIGNYKYAYIGFSFFLAKIGHSSLFFSGFFFFLTFFFGN